MNRKKNKRQKNKKIELNTAVHFMNLKCQQVHIKIECRYHSFTLQIIHKILIPIQHVPQEVKNKKWKKMHIKVSQLNNFFQENLKLSSNNIKRDPFIEI
jgi:hypothetical protein